MNPGTLALMALRGRQLRRAVEVLVADRLSGLACFRCARRLAPGGVCPEHGRTRPPRVRGEGRGQGS